MQDETARRAFVFEYVGVVYGYEWPYIWNPPPFLHANIFGRLIEGEMWLEDTIVLPTTTGVLTEGKAAMFMDTLYDWLGMPFYYRREANMTVFCVVVALDSPQGDIACPGMAQGYCGPRQEPK